MAVSNSPSPAIAPPNIVGRVLKAPFFALLGRVALTTAFWWGGLSKLTDFPSAIAEVRHFGLEPSGLLAAVTIVVELGGSFLLIAGRAVGFAATALVLFTSLATVVGHAFWAVPPDQRFRELNAFLEHIGLIGGFMLAAATAERKSR